MHSVRKYGKPLSQMLLLLLMTGAGAITAQQASGTNEPNRAGRGGFQERYPRYRLQAGDTFDLSFEYSPEFNQTVTVQPDGFLTLREIGDVYVGGMTFPEVGQALSDKYSTILYQPKISVMPKDIQKRYFIAAGEVARPGKYELRGDTTVEQAIAMAGGFAQDRAKHSQVVLFRRNGDTLAFGQVVDVKKMLKARDLREDPYLKPGDLIFVPQTTWSKMRQFVPVPGVGLSMMPAVP
jgi:protein involved in polysaccharide export with SLBB domain